MECNLCENPYPYNCAECQHQMELAIQEDAAMFASSCAEIKEIQQKRIFIGSGEDVCLEELYVG